MTTQEAIDTLNTVITGLRNSMNGETKQIEAYQLAIDQLKGLLDTPSQDLIAATQQRQALEAERTELRNQIASLQNQLDQLSGIDRIIEP